MGSIIDYLGNPLFAVFILLLLVVIVARSAILSLMTNVYGLARQAERTPIRIRLASDAPAAERVNLEALSTESATFRALMEARRSRRESFFVEPTGHINVCNVPLPVRVAR